MGIFRSLAVACTAVLASLGATDRAEAQFAGDLFFLDPSVSVAVGETATLELAFFTGGDVFGIAHAEVSFDPTEVTLEGISVPNAVSDPELMQFKEIDGGLVKIIAMNSVSNSEPIGSVVIAELRMKPLLGSAGTIAINVENKAAFTAGATAYSSSDAANGEIVVTASPASLAAGAAAEPELVENPSAELLARAAALVPQGGVVELVLASGPDAGKRVLVRVPSDGSAPSD